MRKILFLITLLVIIVLGLSSCSKDEAVIDVNQLEGVWGLVSESGYYYDEGEKISYNENYNPFEPTSDCEKIIIQKIGDNRYKMTAYEYYSGTGIKRILRIFHWMEMTSFQRICMELMYL